MNKLKYNEKDKIHFVWLMILVVCVVITYCYQKSKATDNYNKTLQVATSSCNLEITKLLVKDMAPNLSKTALHYAARKGCLDIIRFLILEEKVNIDVLDKYAFKRTALHHAADGGYLENVKFLLENGANPNIRGSDGRNPRDMSVIESRYDKNKGKPYREIIKLLAQAEDQYKSKK
ncbi:ankyrin repeat domain-containing protein [Wolbachia endosymbiont of Pentalonia nigronervosa]|uniref:ankyrin repeat domain-containing protein n=1 Tax=Wolbachia endosymbiont of Pentalonia nigronervosa TaxID=1301914 RepID=UPI00165F18D2|nr:ankyrin repeat domain-containing protein [Wolbachia endosymbiont of Pentalonia nigronervosa]MBD0392033.1 ankyrin repeat domain-containing protein [Wolbachia endosymbiont of Pentalonia nigronervosa]